MTKSIEQIAKETWAEVSKSTTVGESIAVKFAQALLAKIGEGLEPVGVFADVNSLTPENGTRWEHMVDESYNPNEGYLHLYATPHEAIIAAEERVAEACCKALLSMGALGDGDFILRLGAGEWRKYL